MTDSILLEAVGEILREERGLTDEQIKTITLDMTQRINDLQGLMADDGTVLAGKIDTLKDEIGELVKDAHGDTLAQLTSDINEKLQAEYGILQKSVDDSIALNVDKHVAAIEEKAGCAINVLAERVDQKLLDIKDGEKGADASPIDVALALVSSDDSLELLKGVSGEKGLDGKDGTSGIDGEKGLDGKDGTPGIDGEKGLDGKDGTSGIDGEKGLDGKDGTPGIDGEKGGDGVGLDNQQWVDGSVYRTGVYVTANLGQTFKALKDTTAITDSDDWERIGSLGFRFAGSYSPEKAFKTGDLFVKDFGLFLQVGDEAKLLAGRGPQGKPGEKGFSGADGIDGKDGSTLSAIELRSTELVIVEKSADGVMSSHSVDLTPVLEASVAVSKSFAEASSDYQAKVAKEMMRDMFENHISDKEALPVKFFRGHWRAERSFVVGDLIIFADDLYIARQDSSGVLPTGSFNDPLAGRDYWTVMAGSGGGGGGGGGGLPPATTKTIDADGPMDMDSYRIKNLGDPIAWPIPDGKDDAVGRDWVLKNSNNIKIVARVGDLPSTNDLNSPIYPGAAYLIKNTFQGEELNRFAIYDSTISSLGGIATVTAQIDPADVAVIRANSGSSYPGEIYAGGNNDARFTVNYMSDGELKIIINDAGTGYEIGERYQHNGLASLRAVVFTVETLSNANSHGGWRFVDTHSFVKDLVLDKTQSTDQNEGDFLSTVENEKKQLKVFHNGSWIDLFDEVEIKSWIASLSLFEGTAQEVGGSSSSALALNSLPDLAALTAANDLSKTSHYFTWVGKPNYQVKFNDPNIGVDLVGEILNPGDWIQVANQGGDASGIGANGGAIDLKWVHVGGDLLAKSRGDSLFGLNTFTSGSWEKGSVVSYNNALYKAQDGVVGTDIAPGDQAGRRELWDIAVPNDISDGTVITLTFTDVASTTTYAVTHTVTTGETKQQTASALNLAINNEPSVSALVTANEALLLPAVVEIKGNTPGFNFTLASSTADVTSVVVTSAVAPAANKWQKIDLASGIQWVPSDSDLPQAGAGEGELYFVLQSAMAGGAGEVYYWDASASKWLPSGGDKKSEDSIPIGSIMAFATTTPPNGWLKLDGSTFDRAVFTELGNLLNTDTLPDFRGKFLRSTSGTDAMLSLHDFTTGVPKVDFTAEEGGEHKHTLKTKNVIYSHSGTAGEDPNGYGGGGFGDNTTAIRSAGKHTHKIIGGDVETAPDHAIVEYFIKAKNASTVLPRDNFQAIATNLQQGDIWVYDSISQTFKNTQIGDVLGIHDWKITDSYQQGSVVWFDNCLYSCEINQLVNGVSPEFAKDKPEWHYLGQCFRLENDAKPDGSVVTYTGTGYEMKVPMRTAIDVQPVNPVAGDLWLDRATKLDDDFGLKVYDGVSWLLASVANDTSIKGNSLAIPSYFDETPDDALKAVDNIGIAFKYNGKQMQLFGERKGGGNEWEQLTPMLGDPANVGKTVIADADGLPVWGGIAQHDIVVTHSVGGKEELVIDLPQSPTDHINIEVLATITGGNGAGNVIFSLLDAAGAGLNMKNIFTGTENGGHFHNAAGGKFYNFFDYNTDPKMFNDENGFTLYPNDGVFRPGGGPALSKINFRIFRNPNSGNSGWLGHWTTEGPMWGNMGTGFVSFYADNSLFSNCRSIKLRTNTTFSFVIGRVEFS